MKRHYQNNLAPKLVETVRKNPELLCGDNLTTASKTLRMAGTFDGVFGFDVYIAYKAMGDDQFAQMFHVVSRTDGQGNRLNAWFGIKDIP